MKGTILQYQADKPKPTVIEIDGPPTLDALKSAIGGGWLEIVPYFKTIEHGRKLRQCVAFCDENGKLRDLDFNPVATFLWDKAMRLDTGVGCNPDYLVGTIAVVFGDREFMEAL
jgi:hypothetical protein